MKANEAPEKLYIHKSQFWGLMANEHNITKDGIEYTRTDAFIEKAAEYLSYHLDTSKIDVNYKFEFIEEFRKYMKGE